MDFSTLFRRIFIIFLILAVILPFFSTFLFLFALILGAMGDGWGKSFLNHLAWIGTAFWLADLTSVLLMLAVDRVFRQDP